MIQLLVFVYMGLLVFFAVGLAVYWALARLPKWLRPEYHGREPESPSQQTESEAILRAMQSREDPLRHRHA